MKITARGIFLFMVFGGLAGLMTTLRAELTVEQRAQAQESAVALAAGRLAEADKLQPAGAEPADRAEWLERRGRWLLRDERYPEARRDFVAAKKLMPNSIPAAAGLTEVARQFGHEPEAQALIAAVAELRKEEDPNQFYQSSEPGVAHFLLLESEKRAGPVDGHSIDVFAGIWGEALPDALLQAARNTAKTGDVATAIELSTRAVEETGGKFPAAERFRQTVRAALAQAEALEPGLPELGRLRFYAETQLAKGEVYEAQQAAAETLKTGRDRPTFGARQLFWARAVAAVVLRDKPDPKTISEMKAETLEAIHVFASVPEPDAVALLAEAALWARLRQIDPLWLAGTLPAPAKLAADSPLRQLLTNESLPVRSDRVMALETAFMAEWGRGPTAADLETPGDRARWGQLSREGALIAHLRWLTLPAGAKAGKQAWTDARKRTVLAWLCVPEDTATIHATMWHAWFKEPAGMGYVTGKPGPFTQKLKLLSTGKQGRYSEPPENGAELSALLTDVMPLAEGAIDLTTECPGIAAAVAVRVTEVVGRLRLKSQEDVAFIATPLADFVWEWASDPARAMDVIDWGNAQQLTPSTQVRYVFRLPAGLGRTPLGRHVEALDQWVWHGGEAQNEPVTQAAWAKMPSMVWRHALGSTGPRGDFKQLREAGRTAAWGMSLSLSALAGQAIQLLDVRLGDKLIATMDGPAAAEWLRNLAEIETMLKDPGVTPEVRTRLGRQLNLHRAQVLIASGQRERATKELPELVAQVEFKPRQQREDEGANLVEILAKDPKAEARAALLAEAEDKKRREARAAEEAKLHPSVLVTTKCQRCNGRGEVYNGLGQTGTNTYRKVDGTGLTYEKSYNTAYIQCPECGGSGKFEHWEKK